MWKTEINFTRPASHTTRTLDGELGGFDLENGPESETKGTDLGDRVVVETLELVRDRKIIDFVLER